MKVQRFCIVFNPRNILPDFIKLAYHYLDTFFAIRVRAHEYNTGATGILTTKSVHLFLYTLPSYLNYCIYLHQAAYCLQPTVFSTIDTSITHASHLFASVLSETSITFSSITKLCLFRLNHETSCHAWSKEISGTRAAFLVNHHPQCNQNTLKARFKCIQVCLTTMCWPTHMPHVCWKSFWSV